MIHPIDYRYGSKEMREIFEEEKKLEKQLKVEAVLIEALAELGKIPREVAKEVRKKANPKYVSLARVKEFEKETKHDIAAMVKALSEVCPKAKKYIHLTATSYDIVDTSLALQLKEALSIILERGKELLKTCLEICQKHKKTLMVARTHGQHALPITLGFKFANFADKIGEDLERLKEDQKYLVGKFSGAVGNYASQKLLGLGENLEKLIMKKLNLKPADITTQVIPRENIARVLAGLVILACSVEQIAKEIRNLQRTEISELSEPFEKRQIGSSTMAQKRNPIDSENICSNVRVIRSCLLPALENIALEHERDLTNSAAERSILPTIFLLTDDVLIRMNKILKGLVVFPEKMKENLALTKGAILAEAVITELVKKGENREQAYLILKRLVEKAIFKNKNLKEILLKDQNILRYLKPKEIEKIMNFENYLGLSIAKTEKIIKKWQRKC